MSRPHARADGAFKYADFRLLRHPTNKVVMRRGTAQYDFAPIREHESRPSQESWVSSYALL